MSNQIMVIERVAEIDLLQQALAGAADDLVETTNITEQQVLNQAELLNILQGDSSESQTIQLTAEEAAALGLRLEIDSCHPSEIDDGSQSHTTEDISEGRSIQSTDDINNSEDIDIESGDSYVGANGQILVSDNNFQTLTPIIINNKGIQSVGSHFVTSNGEEGDTHPTIQFVEQDGEIRRFQNLTLAQLQELETSIQDQILQTDEPLTNIYNPNTKTRIVYRTVFPEELDLQTPKPGLTSAKRGRPRKTTTVEEKRDSSPELPITKAIRTRSGRLTKPPRHKHFQPLREIDIENTQKPLITPKSEEQQQPPPPEQPKNIIYQKRVIASQNRCPTCNKAYLGLSRLERHLQLYPDHGPLPTKPTSTLWQDALKTVRKASPGNRGTKLLTDISSLIENLQKISSNLIRPLDENGPKFEINETLSLILRIPPGSYTINDAAIEGTKDCKSSVPEELILPVVDTGQDAMMDTSGHEELMSVDQLVNERLYSLTAAELSAPLAEDLASTNPVSNDLTGATNGAEPNTLNIDLSLDLFQFNPS